MEKINKWKSFKNRFKKLWYRYILGKEYKVGRKLTGPNIVILNDEAISTITIENRK